MGPPAGVQAAVWLRLAVLLPLLPVVYADREPDAGRNLRARLATALLRILVSPAAEAAAAAEERAGESLFERVAAVQHALLGGTWAAWLRGDQDKLREVAVFPGLRALQAELDAAPLPPAVRRAIQATIPVLPPPRMLAPPAAPRPLGGHARAEPLATGPATDCVPCTLLALDEQVLKGAGMSARV
ncbi:hypothetical protein WJX81_003856 [Elliptochloris bilobata]|uniref:Uncharacterized protein n=1 Tax=Elliptochloris bilobata TaxID=381761 RepID=A0AAW1RMI7_9CHLO